MKKNLELVMSKRIERRNTDYLTGLADWLQIDYTTKNEVSKVAAEHLMTCFYGDVLQIRTIVDYQAFMACYGILVGRDIKIAVPNSRLLKKDDVKVQYAARLHEEMTDMEMQSPYLKAMYNKAGYYNRKSNSHTFMDSKKEMHHEMLVYAKDLEMGNDGVYYIPDSKIIYISKAESVLSRKFKDDMVTLTVDGIEKPGLTCFVTMCFEGIDGTNSVARTKMKLMFLNGFNVKGIHYDLFAKGASQARDKKTYFSSYTRAEVIKKLLDRDEADYEGKVVNVAKLDTRFMTPGSSSSYIGSGYSFKVLNDRKFKVTFDAVWHKDGLPVYKTVTEQLTQGDGQGKYGIKLGLDIAVRYGKVSLEDKDYFLANYNPDRTFAQFKENPRMFRIFKRIPTAAQLRDEDGAIVKGLAILFDLPRYGFTEDIVFTESQVKLNFRKDTVTIATANINKKKKDRAYTTYQYIQQLNLTKERVDALIQQSLEPIEGVLVDYKKTLSFLNLISNSDSVYTDADMGDDKQTISEASVAAAALRVNPHLLFDPIIRKKIVKLFDKYLIGVKYGRFLVKGAYYYVITDPLAILLGEDSKLLKGKTAYLNGEIDLVALFRAPLVSFFEPNKIQLVNNAELEDHYWYLTDLLILSTETDALLKAQGADCDGDTMLVTSDKNIVDSIPNLPTVFNFVDDGTTSKSDILYNNNNILSFYSKNATVGSNVGPFSNLATFVRDKMASLDMNDKAFKANYVKLTGNMVYLPDLIMREIDKEKTGEIIKLEEEYRAFNEVPGWFFEMKHDLEKPIAKRFVKVESRSAMQYICNTVRTKIAEIKSTPTINQADMLMSRLVSVVGMLEVEKVLESIKQEERLFSATARKIYTVIPKDEAGIKAQRDSFAVAKEYYRALGLSKGDRYVVATAAYISSINNNGMTSYAWSCFSDELLDLFAKVNPAPISFVRFRVPENTTSVLIDILGNVYVEGKIITTCDVEEGIYNISWINGSSFLEVPTEITKARVEQSKSMLDLYSNMDIPVFSGTTVSAKIIPVDDADFNKTIQIIKGKDVTITLEGTKVVFNGITIGRVVFNSASKGLYSIVTNKICKVTSSYVLSDDSIAAVITPIADAPVKVEVDENELTGIDAKTIEAMQESFDYSSLYDDSTAVLQEGFTFGVENKEASTSADDTIVDTPEQSVYEDFLDTDYDNMFIEDYQEQKIDTEGSFNFGAF